MSGGFRQLRRQWWQQGQQQPEIEMFQLPVYSSYAGILTVVEAAGAAATDEEAAAAPVPA